MKRSTFLVLLITLICTLAVSINSIACTEECSSKQSAAVKSDIKITVGSKEFSATLNDSKAAKAFKEKLPMTIDMNELHGNEKYFYFDENLPTNPKVQVQINAGDLMIYGNDCLVLFYTSFFSDNRYTPIGEIDNPQGLADAVGSGDVVITFE